MARTRRGSRSSTGGGMLGSRRPMGARQNSTMAAPAPTQSVPIQTHRPPPPPPSTVAATSAAPSQPGLFSQMASTAAGVAVGSAVGHTIGAGITGLFSGGGSSDAAQQANQYQAQLQQQPIVQETQRTTAGPCEIDARNFTRCLDEHNGELSPCDYYLQQLKACQEAARQY
ncbi:Mix17p PWA37_003012 [Arxiozyma heterogenica]|uniref:CHCH domain-containing protein n=1 Tax=Arxiozyma heterogenica TaxID=278026 RepID=A0AAN7ZRE6_9SACH|nr:hypothetical protein RI543_004792 [Kazachstania heterogenica]